MSTTLMAGPAAGWYHDPADDRAWRWWDGTTWTEHVQPKAGAAAAQPAPVTSEPAEAPAASAAAVVAPAIPQPGEVAPPPPAPAAGQTASATPIPVSDQLYWHSSAAEVVEVPRLNHGRRMAERTATAVPSYVRDWHDLGSPNTAGIWLLAATPFLTFPVALLVGVLFGFAGIPAPLDLIVAAAILLGLSWIFATLDAHALAARGYHPPSIWWMLLFPPLAYLIARGKAIRRERRRAWPPELLFFAGFLVNGGLLALAALAALALIGSAIA